MSHKSFATEDQLTELIVRYQSGESTTALPDIVGCNRNTVQKTLRRCGIKLRTTGETNKIARTLKGKNNPNWKGGVSKTSFGYLAERLENGAQIMQHRRIMQDYLGRNLGSREAVHHINGNKTDNRLANLQLTTWSAHMRQHAIEGEYHKRPGMQKALAAVLRPLVERKE